MRALPIFTLLLASCGGGTAENEAGPARERGKPVVAPASALSPAAAPARLARRSDARPTKTGYSPARSPAASGSRFAARASGTPNTALAKAPPNSSCAAAAGRACPIRAGARRRLPLPAAPRATSSSAAWSGPISPPEPNNPAISDGVMVLDGEKVIGLQLCDDADTVSIDYDLAEAHFPRADELFSWETDRADRRTR